jgi:hypothetical protein
VSDALPKSAWTRDDASDAALSLRDEGFAAVTEVLSPSDLREAEGLIDSLFEDFDAMIARQKRGRRRFAHDMAAEDSEGADQPEILYAASLDPRLAGTSLFQKCASFAQAIIGARVARSFDHVIVKSPWNNSVTPWHQDAALTRFGAAPLGLQADRLHFWIPLQDATEANGCMEFLPGSHREPLLHHTSYRRADGDKALAAAPADEGGRVACPVAAGGFTIHTPRTLHYTGRNATARSRKAWIIHFSRFGGAEIALKRLFGRVPRALR